MQVFNLGEVCMIDMWYAACLPACPYPPVINTLCWKCLNCLVLQVRV